MMANHIVTSLAMQHYMDQRSTSTPGPPEALRKLPLCKIGEVRLRGVNIGGAGSFIYKKPSIDKTISPTESASKIEDKKVAEPSKSLNKAFSFTTFAGEPNLCPRCKKKVFFAEKVTSLGKDWHRPCLRCERCSKTLTPGSLAEVRIWICVFYFTIS
ncbi:cysteine-rich protein 2-like isoform X4 [Pyxicephalus adspersus]|uniref:cysteine-rich protein 2-like isoform X4 n=1 Tax=Pyxicephalus adspersus TaxID=30357 RepID=UPI003B59B654